MLRRASPDRATNTSEWQRECCGSGDDLRKTFPAECGLEKETGVRIDPRGRRAVKQFRATGLRMGS
jgi:hypothetical protein